MKSSNPSTPIIASIAAVAVIIGAVTYVFNTEKPANTTRSQPSAFQTADGEDSDQVGSTYNVAGTGTAIGSGSSSGVSSTATYKDGTYSASSSYMVPHAQNNITVKITIANGAVSSVSASHNARDDESQMYVSRFNQSIDSAVVGKPFKNISLSRVGGASLTTDGFTQALAAIANQAKA